jgi:geranylgeranyl diphosphate synthase type II
MMIQAPSLEGSNRPQISCHISLALNDYGARTRDYIIHYLNSQPKSPYLSELIADYPNRGGKMMRPSICLATACTFGADLEEVVPFAASIELLHNALLIHDDIQDESEKRRGLPTLHALHGIPLAINAGDTLLMLALGPLLSQQHHYGGVVGHKLIELTLRMARETAEGQALDIGWRRDNRLDISSADYLDMVLKKTAWMATIWPAQIGLLIGSKGRVDPTAVIKFGFFLGACFQIQDDVLNLNPSLGYGKEAMGDLYEGKKTLMLIHARENSTPEERKEIDRILTLNRFDRNTEEIVWLHNQMLNTGSIIYARTVAEALGGAALHEFSLVFGHLPDSPAKRFIENLVTWILEREC